MAREIKTDICVIGAGSGGLSVAAGAQQMGSDTVLIEKDKMGGDCLNTGCVPSKALLAAGHAAEAARDAQRFGITTSEPEIDWNKIHAHVHGAIATIAPNDSVERFEGLGVNVVQAEGRFIDRRTVEAGDARINARRFVIATGSRALVPPIAGLNDVAYLTNETIFDLQQRPRHLLVVGGGPIGLEMAQAFRNLGSVVTVLEMFSILPKDDPDLVTVVRQRLQAQGVDIREGVKVVRLEKTGDDVTVIVEKDGKEASIVGSHLLIATGRQANVQGLGLEEAGIEHTAVGIQVDARLRTTNKKVFAIGDVTGGLQFTHRAGYQAGIVIRNALFRLPAKSDTRALPWVTYADPELAQVGLTEAEAMRQGLDHKVLTWPFKENDRAIAEAQTDGLIKAIVTPKGHILGAGIVGPHAGELIQTWVLAMGNKLKIGAVAGMIAPYPTLGEVSKRAAGSFYTPSLFSKRTQMIVRFLSRFG
jgi:pyruvate/2-oxoglutarate dehydrogenase complex dihydrolipoamide dehydrogenase (E3) component